MLFFITGWPACGQGSYGEFLATHHDFRHLDLDLPPAETGEVGFRWERDLPERTAALAADLRRMHPRWVVTTESPVDSLPHLERLQEAGFDLWFLQPQTEAVSRLSWIQREREIDAEVRPVVWDRQAAAIRKVARQLRPFFRDRCVTTLNDVRALMDGASFAIRLGVAAPV